MEPRQHFRIALFSGFRVIAQYLVTYSQFFHGFGAVSGHHKCIFREAER